MVVSQIFKKISDSLELSEKKSLSLVSVAVAAAFFPLIAPAQTVTPDDQRRIQNEEQRWRTQREAEARERELAKPSVDLGEEGAPPGLKSKTRDFPDEKPCHMIKEVTFELPTQLSEKMQKEGRDRLPQDTFHFLKSKASVANGRCLGQQGIGLLVNQLLLELVQRGYTTTRIGLIPQQDLATGVLRLSLLPGYISAFKVNGDPVPPNVAAAFPTKAGNLLNLRELEQGIEQLQQVSSYEVSMQLVPGEAAGASDVVLTFKRNSPWHLSFSVDDSGSRATGKYQAGVNFSYDDVLGLNDVFTVGATHDLDHTPGDHSSKSQNARYSVPFGRWTFSWSGSRNQSYQLVKTALNPYYTESDQSNMDMKASYMFWRNQVQKNDIGLRIAKRWSQSATASFVIPSQRRNMTYAELSWVHRHYFGPTKLDLTLSHTWGVPWAGGHDDTDLDYFQIPRSALHYNFQVLDATLSTPINMFGVTAQYTGTFRMQVTHTPQDSSNLFSIGGRYTVRGFDGENSFSAEQGYYLRNELQIPLGKTGQNIYLGLDGGRVFGPSMAGNPLRAMLAGATIGFRGSFFKGMSYDVFAATPVYKPREFNSSPALGFNLRQSF